MSWISNLVHGTRGADVWSAAKPEAQIRAALPQIADDLDFAALVVAGDNPGAHEVFESTGRVAGRLGELAGIGYRSEFSGLHAGEFVNHMPDTQVHDAVRDAYDSVFKPMLSSYNNEAYDIPGYLGRIEGKADEFAQHAQILRRLADGAS